MLKLLLQRLTQKFRNIFAKSDVLAFYDFVRLPPVVSGLNPGEAANNTINWVVPPFGKGSGGHLNIFRFVSNLEKMGFKCRIILFGTPQPASPEHHAKKIQ